MADTAIAVCAECGSDMLLETLVLQPQQCIEAETLKACKGTPLVITTVLHSSEVFGVLSGAAYMSP